MSNWKQEGYDPSQHGWHKGEIDGLPRGGYAKNYFFADTFRCVDTAFGNFFNNMHIYHFTKEGEPKKEIEIPIKYGPRTKAFDYRTEKETGKKYYVQLPNITYQQTGAQWSAERASGQREVRTFYAQYFDKNGVDYTMQEKFWKDIQPVPYDITYELVGHFEFLDDANQFSEQILARFSPECYLNVKEFWFANIRRSLKMKLDSYSREANVDYQEEEKREITVTFAFTVEAMFYKPIEVGYIIDQIVTTLKVNKGGTDHAWQFGISGNYDGSFDSRYNFKEIYGTKLGRVSAVKPESTIMMPNFAASSFVAKYEYEELADITNYPWGSKQLYAVSSIWDPNKEHINALATYNEQRNQWIPIPSACSAMIAELQPKVEEGEKPDSEKFGFIYEVKYEPGFGQVPRDIINEETHVVLTAAGAETPRGGMTIRAYKDLSGYGDFTSSAVWRAGTKDADLGVRVVKDAPYITSAGILHEDK